MVQPLEPIVPPATADADVFAHHARFGRPALLGSGGMGRVYRVHDAELGCSVALKTLRDLAPEQVFRLKNEFRSIAGVVHPNLAQLHELFVANDACFFTMELVEGPSFVEHVRSDPASTTADVLARFMAVAPQLVRGVAALHAKGRLHRDVKPSNVRVTPEGRVILLDFDLVIPLARGHAAADEEAGRLVGTVAYMAPEQMWGTAVDGVADLYAVGVIFFEALTGRLPFEGSVESIIGGKTSGEAPDPRTIVPDLPDWLAELTMALLRRRPEERPGAAVVLERLETAAGVPVSLVPESDLDAFVGRSHELAELRRGAELAREHPVVVCIRGPSGIGKTELVRRFLGEVGAAPDALVLAGRCHAQESVAYNAFDAVVDDASRFLVRQGADVRRALLPRDGAALVRLFPVLSRVPDFGVIEPLRADADSVELRHRGFAALRELLVNVGRRHRLIVWIDDLQWGDVDSIALLDALVTPPDPPNLLFILSQRDDAGHDAMAALRAIRERDRSAFDVRQLDLGPLGEEECAELARQVLPGTDAAVLARQSGGSPFLLTELARHARPRGALSLPDALDLAAIIHARIAEMAPAARRIVELAAVAGSPIDRSSLLQAAREGEAGRPLLARLEALCLVRACQVGSAPGVETYHDRIRETVLADLSPDLRRACHRDLGTALEVSGRGAPEALAHHFHGAGVLSKAADYAVAAADRAMDALAFASAAEFYERARSWDRRDDAWQRVLLTREGEALSSAARFAEGARVFLSAARGAAPSESLDLRRRAAESLFAGGEFDEAVEVLGVLLRDLDIPYPRTPRRALLRTVQHLLRLLVRGLQRRDGSEAPTREDLVRIDTCYSVGRTLVMSDSTLGVYFSFEALSRALQCNDPVRLGRCLCVVGGSLAAAGGGALAKLGEKMLRLADQIAAETRSPLLLGTISVGTGQVAMIRGQWRLALERCDAGAKLLAETCRGVAFDCNIGRGNAQRALEELGDIDDLEVRARDFLQATITTGARYAEVAASQHLSMALLARDDVAGARPLARKGQEMWSRSGFHMQHFYSIRQEAYCDLYEGDAARSYRRLREIWPELKRSNLLRISLTRIDALGLRARVALATAAAGGGDARELLRTAAGDAKVLAAEGRPDATAHAELARAGVAIGEGDRARAIAHLDAAIVAAQRAEMPLLAACAQLRHGEIVGGATGDASRTDAEAALQRGGVRRPAAWAELHAPRFPGGQVAAPAEAISRSASAAGR